MRVSIISFITTISTVLGAHYIQAQPQPVGPECLNSQPTISGLICNDIYKNGTDVLLRDTCAEPNRFTNRFFGKGQGLSYGPSAYYYHKAILIDRQTALSIRKTLGQTTSLNSKNFVRLFGGFVDDLGDSTVIVQFVPIKEFKKNNYYQIHMNLIADRERKLYYAIFKKREQEVDVIVTFPRELLKKNVSR